MRYVSAYMLAAMGAKHHVTANDIGNILGSVGVDCEHDKVEDVIKKMEGKTLDELIREGSKYLASISAAPPCIGGTLTASAATSLADNKDAVTASSAKKEEKKEKEEESDEDMGFGLFD
ncbi:Uncharacterized protein BM_BM6949 [Brugia malayi]|uniref:Large ribosomal subunit protein P2 n=2 Tax=Brugia TaxID=6278 RepID=A0A0K0JQB1_BRUMA|nr:Uncharacterized protein BM_BM6949 [Brugia malayi]CDQ00850.1 BMA-RLA-2 [Brugia malayi]VIO86595.1 Uncharacterized protein BM_BM6949 [Brugia malayi]